MNGLPPYEPPQRLAEGEYGFIISEYEKRRYPRRDGKGDFIVVKFIFKVEMPDGSMGQHRESIPCGEDRYKDLLFAIGATKGADGSPHLSETINIEGSRFVARIVYEPDKNDASKSWARISQIQYEPPESDEEEDVPMPNGNNGEPGEPDEELPF